MKMQLEEKIKKGYDRLVTFQTSEKGYEWFGKSPAHEALSSYAVVEFTDIHNAMGIVDQKMMGELNDWLKSRKDGQGSFLLSDQALDSFGRAPQTTSDAYIIWALSEAGQTDLDTEVAALKNKTDESNDPYIIGLLTASLYNLGRDSEARTYADRLESAIEESSGKVADALTSITSSKGEYLDIETSSIAVIAWMHEQSRYSTSIEKAINFIQKNVDAGSYGSTQSTVLALKALTTYMKEFSSINGEGDFVLRVNGQEAARKSFSQDTKDKIAFDITEYLLEH